jgi:osmoprotectant transport system substrate-binding protein
MKRSLIASIVLGSMLLAACGDDDESASTTPTAAPRITISAANFPESQLLSEIYGQALENSGYRIARKDPIGSRELYYQAILADEIQLIPEYTNSLLSFVLRQADPNASPTATNLDEQVAEINEALPENLTIGQPSNAQDKDVIVCSREVADQYELATLSQLAEVSGEIRLGAPPEFETRAPFGLVGFQEIYGADFKEFVPLQIGQIADAITGGQIDCGNMFSTMSSITTKDLVALEDDKVIVPNENVLPLLTRAAATPELLQIVDAVSAQLDTDKLKAMMVTIEVDGQSPDVVAKAFLAGEYNDVGTTTTVAGDTTTTTTG